MIKIEVTCGEEVIEKITTVIKKRGIASGSITLIGGIDSCCISTMDKNDAKKDILTEYHEPLEMSGTGEILDGKPHIHAILGEQNNNALFGHLHWAKVRDWFVHVYITPLTKINV
jgi:uncharacterized protein